MHCFLIVAVISWQFLNPISTFYQVFCKFHKFFSKIFSEFRYNFFFKNAPSFQRPHKWSHIPGFISFFSNTFSTLNVSDYTTVSQTGFFKTRFVRPWYGHWRLRVKCLRKKNSLTDHGNLYGHWSGKKKKKKKKKKNQNRKWSIALDKYR